VNQASAENQTLKIKPQKQGNPRMPVVTGSAYTPPWLGLLHTRRQVDIAGLMVAVTMLASSLVFFGFVALSQILLCVVAAMSAYLPAMLLMWIFHKRPQVDSVMHAITMAIMLGMLMPINSFPWQHMLGGTFLGIFMPFVGRAHRIRMHPAVLAIIVTWALPLMISNVHEQYTTHMLHTDADAAVLRPDRVVWGDVRKSRELRSYQPWWLTGENSLIEPHEDSIQADAIARPNPHQTFIRDQKRLLRFPRNLANMMASGELPRIEELLLGCVPGMIGATSQGLMILLGLYLMYKRLSWWSIPVIVLLSACLTLMAMPITIIHGETTVFWVLRYAPPAFGITYLGYFFLTSPMLLIAFILAPATCPLTSLGRLVYCILIGMLAVLIQWFVQIPELMLLSVLIAGVVSRMLDNLHFRPGR
jgi:Na+-translocating ferredoxin:NAD+ oxidoreductase RnfD subunit